MITFRALGVAELKGPEGRSVQSVLARPKLLGLLAYLAVASPRGFHRRDSLLPLLWEELDEDRARRALRQSLYHLRRALGEGAIVTHGDEEVGLDENVIWCDTAAFADALDRDSPQDALDLYRGHLLEGFNVAGAVVFERWVDDRREELRRAARTAAWQLAERAEAEGDSSGAADWARRAVSLDPFDESLVCEAIALLDRAGNRSGAVREYEAFARRLDDELGLEPSPETRALAEAVRARSTAAPPREYIEEGSTAALEPAASELAGPEPAAAPAARPGRKRRPLIPVLAAAMAVVLIVAGILLWPDKQGPVSTEPYAPDPRSIAVLPFENLGGEAETDPFVSGIHEDILIHLYKIAGLRPISRTSVMEYRDTRKNLKEIADELGVATVLEGGVQRVGNRVRITVQLIDAETDEHIWAEVYERNLTAENIFSIQTEISNQIAVALRARLSAEEAERIAYQPTRSLEAYNAHLTAREYQRRWRASEENQRIAVQQYERAIELEPEFALAYADLSEFQSRVCYIYGCPDEVMARTKDLAERAVALEPDLAAARVALGNYYYYGLSEHERAMEEYLRAIELEPNNSDAHGQLAAVRARMGNLTDAVASVRKAVELSPRDSDAHDFLGHIYLWLREYQDAIRSYDRSIALAPDVYYPRFWKTWAILNLEGGDRAIETWTRGVEALGSRMLPFSVLFYGRTLVRVLGPEIPVVRFPGEAPLAEASYLLSRATADEAAGDIDSARAWYDSARVFLEEPSAGIGPEYRHAALGVVYARLGRKSEAIREATRAVELVPVSADASEGPWFVATLAEVYVVVGDLEAALDQLEVLLSISCPVSPPLLEADPVWTPLREHPRYRALVGRER
jgi:serine/threonine-protein kinase